MAADEQEAVDLVIAGDDRTVVSASGLGARSRYISYRCPMCRADLGEVATGMRPDTSARVNLTDGVYLEIRGRHGNETFLCQGCTMRALRGWAAKMAMAHLVDALSPLVFARWDENQQAIRRAG